MRAFLFLLLPILISYGQQSIPENYFIHPLDIPLSTSGTFGELRSNHFHSGVDLKTNGEEGLPVFASASGTISRIKISFFGYGKAIYISHPNGYTTVYAHLKKFSPAIEAYIKKRQYAKESYEIQLYPTSEILTVTQGDIIAYSGNTGGSGGPHLHFEIRDASARPMNPLNFGIKVKDTKKPIISSLWLYPLDKNSHINGNHEKVKLRMIPQKNGGFKTEKVIAAGTIGVGISTYDQQDLASNKNGVYQIMTTINGQKNFEFQMDRFSFSETRYINRLVDYGYYKKNRERITKLFIEKNNPLSIYAIKTNTGTISVENGLSYSSHIKISDNAQNAETIDIEILGGQLDSIQPKMIKTTPYYVAYNENFTYSADTYDVFIPKGSLYENEYLDIWPSGDTIHIHEDIVPMQKKMTVVFDVSKYTEADKKQLYIGELGYNGKHYFCSTKKKESRFSTRSRTLGSYMLFTDNESPVIKPVNVADQQWISKENFLKIKIDDDQSGIDRYEATINGKFILMEYDYKTGMLVYDFNDKVNTESQNKFELIVLDKVGNSTTFETTFFRKP